MEVPITQSKDRRIQRVEEEEREKDAKPCRNVDVFPGSHEITYSDQSAKEAQAIVTPDSGPSQRTRSKTQQILATLEEAECSLTTHQVARQQISAEFLTEFANAVLEKEAGELLEYRHLVKRPMYKKDWDIYFGNSIRRLAQGMPGRNKGTNTIFFINKSEVPDNRWKDIAYSRIVCDV